VIAFVIRRLFQAILVMTVVALCAFLMFQYVGDPVLQMVGQDATTEDREALRERLGLNDPTPVQFLRFLGNVAQGEFGHSYRLGRPVDTLIAERLSATLELVFVATVFALGTGIFMGVYSGLRPHSVFARVFQWVSLLGVSLPTFFIGILLIIVFGVRLGWLPVFGRGEVVNLGGWTTGFLTWSGLKSLILPSITLGLFQMTITMRLVRSEILEVLRTDYIKFARARGISDRIVHFVYALKNTLVPVITVIGLQVGSLIAFAIITETVFQWPGTGLMFVQAVQFADIPVMSTYLILVALVFVIINLIVDLLYFFVDPRLRLERPTTAAAAA